MIGLRFFTVYGPGGRPDMMTWKCAKAILNGDEIEIYNHGNLERDFTYIDDIIDGIIAATTLEKEYEIYNLGNNKPEKLLNLIELLETFIGKKAKHKYVNMQSGDVLKTYADITKAQTDFGYSPKVSIDVGLKHFVEWFKDYKYR